jgi:hypothetical protein
MGADHSSVYQLNDYSVPTTYGHRDVLVRGYVHEVVISCGAEVIARHPRSYEREDFVFEPLPQRGSPYPRSGVLKEKPQLGDWGACGWGFRLRGGTQLTLTLHATPISNGFTELGCLLRCSTSGGWSARLDIDCLGGLYGLRGLFDREMQYALVVMSVDGSVLWLERQGY